MGKPRINKYKTPERVKTLHKYQPPTIRIHCTSIPNTMASKAATQCVSCCRASYRSSHCRFSYLQFDIQWSSLGAYFRAHLRIGDANPFSALLFYDYALTFPSEVKYIWGSKMRLSTFLYIFCRYALVANVLYLLAIANQLKQGVRRVRSLLPSCLHICCNSVSSAPAGYLSASD